MSMANASKLVVLEFLRSKWATTWYFDRIWKPRSISLGRQIDRKSPQNWPDSSNFLVIDGMRFAG